MRHQHQQKQRENSPIAPDIPFADDASDDDGPLSPRSRRRAEYTIARLQQGMLGRARSMFGGRDQSPVGAIDVSKNGITDKRPPIKSPHRTLEFFTLWAAGRHKRAATIAGPAVTTKNARAATAQSLRDSVLVDNTNRHSQPHPSTVVRNVTVQKQQHVSSAVTQRIQQRRNVDHVDAAPPTPASMRLRHSDSFRTATTLTTTSTTANGSSSHNSSSIRTSKQRYTRNNSLDISELGRPTNDHQHQRRSSHHHPSLASAYASADEADDRDDPNEATHNDDRHVVFVNKQLFRNGGSGGVARDDEHRRPMVADGVKRLIATRGISAAATDKHSIIINNHSTTRPPEASDGRTQQRAGILQRHNSAGETAAMTVATEQPTESGVNGTALVAASGAAVAEIGTQLRVASSLGRPKKKLSFREPVENDSKPFVFKSDTLPRAKRFIATIERQRQQQSNTGSGGGILVERIDDDQLEVVIDIWMCVWVGGLWVVYFLDSDT